jgi:hypothetical protein
VGGSLSWCKIHLFLHSPVWFLPTCSCHLVKILIQQCWFTVWPLRNPPCQHSTLDIKENKLQITNAAFFAPGEFGDWLSLSFQVIRKYPSFITSNYLFQQIWFIPSVLQKVRTDFLLKFFLFGQ